MKRVVINILSARGSKKLPAREDWEGNALAIHPSNCKENQNETGFFCMQQIYTKSVIPATANNPNAVE